MKQILSGVRLKRTGCHRFSADAARSNGTDAAAGGGCSRIDDWWHRL